MRAEGFSCSLDVLYGELGKSKLQFLIKKILKKFNYIPVFFSSIFGHQNSRSGLDPDSLNIEIQQKSGSSLDSMILNPKKYKKMQKKIPSLNNLPGHGEPTLC